MPWDPGHREAGGAESSREVEEGDPEGGMIAVWYLHIYTCIGEVGVIVVGAEAGMFVVSGVGRADGRLGL